MTSKSDSVPRNSQTHSKMTSRRRSARERPSESSEKVSWSKENERERYHSCETKRGVSLSAPRIACLCHETNFTSDAEILRAKQKVWGLPWPSQTCGVLNHLRSTVRKMKIWKGARQPARRVINDIQHGDGTLPVCVASIIVLVSSPRSAWADGFLTWTV